MESFQFASLLQARISVCGKTNKQVIPPKKLSWRFKTKDASISGELLKQTATKQSQLTKMLSQSTTASDTITPGSVSECLNNSHVLLLMTLVDIWLSFQLTRSVCIFSLRKTLHPEACECCVSLPLAEHHHWLEFPSKYLRAQLLPLHTPPGTGGLGQNFTLATSNK